MAKKKFLSVGLEMAINHIDHCDFDSDPSLLDKEQGTTNLKTLKDSGFG